MARPRIDPDEERARLLDACDALLRRTRGVGLTVTALAAECGMSQSNAYRFFPSKAALLAALASRWFAEVEEKLAEIVSSGRPPREALRAFLLTQFEIKTARYREDPALFDAYLALAGKAPDAVAEHALRLRSMLQELVSALPGANEDGAALVEDMTLPLRDPFVMSRMKGGPDTKRAERLVDAVLSLFEAGDGRQPA